MSNPRSHRLDGRSFAAAVGCAEAELPPDLRARIAASDFRYSPLTPDERDRTILEVLKRIDGGELSRVGEHRQEIWEKGWEENLEAFAAEGFNLEALVPRFVRPNPVIRFNQDYVRSLVPHFELQFHDIVRRWLFMRYMSDAARIFEFGCGSSYNLVAMAEIAPDKAYIGLDWAASAVKLADLIGRTRGIPLSGRRFDLFHPDADLDLGGNDAALTICALEQTGTRHESFLQFLLHKRPRICVHMEPLLDLYEPDKLADYLAIRYHTSRGYLSGFLERLRQLQDERRLEILQVRRFRFGSLFHEGYSLVVWRPL